MLYMRIISFFTFEMMSSCDSSEDGVGLSEDDETVVVSSESLKIKITFKNLKFKGCT
jgi:hypothetical protein